MIMNREGLINAALEHQSKFETCDGEGTLVGFANGMHKQSYESFIAGAEWQAKQLSWISVEERLPETKDEVLVLNRMKRSDKYFVSENCYTNGDWAAKSAMYYEEIAWMPIPSFDEILEANRDVLERIKEKGD